MNNRPATDLWCSGLFRDGGRPQHVPQVFHLVLLPVPPRESLPAFVTQALLPLSFFLHSQEWLCHFICARYFRPGRQARLRRIQVTRNQRSDTTRRRRRDMAPIMEEPQTNAKNACVCATNPRPQNVISPISNAAERLLLLYFLCRLRASASLREMLLFFQGIFQSFGCPRYVSAHGRDALATAGRMPLPQPAGCHCHGRQDATATAGRMPLPRPAGCHCHGRQDATATAGRMPLPRPAGCLRATFRELPALRIAGCPRYDSAVLLEPRGPHYPASVIGGFI